MTFIKAKQKREKSTEKSETKREREKRTKRTTHGKSAQPQLTLNSAGVSVCVNVCVCRIIDIINANSVMS